MSKEATIQRVKEVLPIEGADNIELVKVLGWQCVSKKGEFKQGDLCVYFEIDSFLPIKPEFEFLRKYCYKKLDEQTEGFRLKTIKLRGQISQGLCLPLGILKPQFMIQENISQNEEFLEEEFDGWKENVEDGFDVSKILGVTHYEKPVPVQLSGQVKRNFPSFLFKTDEVRVQSAPELLEKIQGNPYYITTKLDGTSFTAYKKDGEFGVCSRNLELKEDENNSYWKVANKYNLKEILPNNICIQGELVGPGVQKNPMMLKELDLYIFNVYEIKGYRKFNFSELFDFCANNNLKMVPIEVKSEEPFKLFSYTQEELLEKAKGNYDNSPKKKEGIVVRSLDQAISFKVLNNEFLLKEE